MSRHSGFLTALCADGPAPDRAEKLSLYGWLVGRARGADIVQEGNDTTGAPVRWTFTDITPDSFRWLGERSDDGGKTYWLQAEFLATRVST